MMDSDSAHEIEAETEEIEQHGTHVKSGWLSKQGGSHKNIKKRWFILTKNALRYFKSDKGGSPLGVVFLRRVVGVEKLEETKGGFPFELQTPERVYLLFAQSSSEQGIWTETLKGLISQHSKDDSLKIVKSGYLTKQGGGFKSWKKRWFVLTRDNILSYYQENGDVVPLGVIDLEKCLDARMSDSQKGPGFDLVTAERTYSILASSKEELEGWMHIILEIVGNVVDGNHQLRVPNDEDDDVPVSPDEISNFIKVDTKITKEGFLVKQGGKIKTWKRRWFVLRESTLAYYKDDKDDKPLGLISLQECKSFELASQKVAKPYSFEIATPDRVYICSAKNEDEMWEWINVLSSAVSKAGGKETFEFIALKKAAELAEKKKKLQIQVYRKATAKNFRRKIARIRNNQNKQPIAPKISEDSKWTKQVKSSSAEDKHLSGDIEAEEQKMLDDLEKISGGLKKTDLTDSIMMMEKDIAALNTQLVSKGERSDAENLDELDDDFLEQARNDEKGVVLCYARAIMDFNPNAYDDEALGFFKGDVIIVENKDESGNWRGRLVKKSVAVVQGGKAVEYSKSGTFPYRYVEEIDPPSEFAQEVKAPAPSDASGQTKSEGWTEQLDNAVGTLFEMYDSDADGYMTKLDFFEFLYEFGKTYLTDKQVDRCWETLDVKKVGKVDAPSFREGIRKLDAVDFFSSWSG